MEFDTFRPIYIQIVEDIKTKIISGEYPCNMQLSAVRNLASELRVNPNTVQRAYQELEHEKLVYADRTNGRFVTDDMKLIKSLKEELTGKKIEEFLGAMKKLGITKQEIIHYLKEK